jgi:hypothetical protein
MIELTEKQVEAMSVAGGVPQRVLNPVTREAFVLIPVEEYDRLKADFDSSPLTQEELECLAWEITGNESWNEFDHIPEKS